MNVLFLTLIDFDSMEERNIYTDLLREFVKHEHYVYAISPVERRKREKTHLIKEERSVILKLKIGNMQKTNIVVKGISTISIETIFISGIKKYFGQVKFDIIIYSTPPITFCNAIEFVKKRDNAKTYLLLKDIFPQNAIDIGILKKTGVKSVFYKYFRRKEKKLYKISNYIGCMSKANVDYILKHNREINSEIVEVCPNCIEVIDKSVGEKDRVSIRNKYGIPLDKKVFIYGGNLGKPQGIDYLIKCLHSQRKNMNVFFLIVGDGTEYDKLEQFVNKNSQDNLKLIKRLPKEDYDAVVGVCDIGMIFLDHRFTIPNFPSRLLSYMQAKLPVLACTDSNTDIGKIVEDGNFGWWCESDKVSKFTAIIKKIGVQYDSQLGKNGWDYLMKKYSSSISYSIIMEHFK